MRKVSLTVRGRVQGVGFRFMTKMVADKLGIVGTVKNQWDGSVYIEAGGSPEKVAEFINLIKASPSPSGRVETCEITELPNLQLPSTFDVRY